MRALVILGAGGFGQEAVWVAEEMNAILSPSERWDLVGYQDDQTSLHGSVRYGHPVLGPLGSAIEGRQDIWFHCAVARNEARERIVTEALGWGWRPATLIHPNVVIAKFVQIGEGSYLGAGAIVAPSASIGRFVLVNNRVAVGHDSVVGDFAQLCPGAQINGHAVVEKGALVGSNASIHQGARIGEFAVVGANSMVVGKVRPRTTVIGIPARSLGTERA